MSAERGPGRPRRCPDSVLTQILVWRDEGWTFQRICDALNHSGIETPGGGRRWYRSHLSRLLKTRSALAFDRQRLSASQGSSIATPMSRKPAHHHRFDAHGHEGAALPSCPRAGVRRGTERLSPKGANNPYGSRMSAVMHFPRSKGSAVTYMDLSHFP